MSENRSQGDELPVASGKREKDGVDEGVASTPRKLSVPAISERTVSSPLIPVQTDTRCSWLQWAMAQFSLCGLYDPRSTYSVMRSVGVQIAAACGQPLRTRKAQAFVADGRPTKTIGIATHLSRSEVFRKTLTLVFCQNFRQSAPWVRTLLTLSVRYMTQ